MAARCDDRVGPALARDRRRGDARGGDLSGLLPDRSPGPRPSTPRGAETTLRTSRNEADELRRRIAAPGIPDEEIDLEEIRDDDFAASTGSRLVLAPETAAEHAEPLMQAEPDGASEAEVEVPIEIEVAPGTTRVSLTLKLVLHLKR